MADIIIDNGETRVGGTTDEIKSLFDFIILLGDTLKNYIPGVLDDKFVAVIKFAAGKPDVMEFLTKLVDLVKSINIQKVKEEVARLKAEKKND